MLCSIWFYKRQNQGAFTGGAISWPKAFWLYHAVFSWYFVPLVYASHPEVDIVLKCILVGHTVIWWIRAPIELVMIYKTYNWSPRYGIVHDILHCFLLFVAILVSVKIWEPTLINAMAFAYLGVTVVMLCFETSFAALFLNVRGHEDHKIYYAADEPKWRFINRLTTVALLIGMGHAIVQAALAMLYLS